MSLPARVAAIIIEVAAEYGVPPKDVVGPRRPRSLVVPRWEAMRRVRALTMASGHPPSLPVIGVWFGGRDHTTVLHGLRQSEKMTYAAEAATQRARAAAPRRARAAAFAPSSLDAALERLGVAVAAKEARRRASERGMRVYG